MSHTLAIVIVVAIIAMAIDPFVEWWQMMTSVSEKIANLEWSVNDLNNKLTAYRISNSDNSSENLAKLEIATKNLAIATSDLKIAKQDDAKGLRHQAITAADDGLSHALLVRQFLDW